ncbi:hypothetical protein ACFXPN_20075 [Streptomyces griseorubiginosus]|uniref:hypothetical protein n=1 Tax=Streptomyces griseorubiginosus TaxID=67304 RepID=UPI00367A21A5
MTTFADSFDRPDSSNLGVDWAEVSGDWAILGGQLSPGSAGGTIILRLATPMATSDHFVQVTIAATTAASHGVWARGNSNVTSGYLWRNDGTEWTLFAVVGGSFTAIGSYTAAAAPGDVAKLQAIGSTITGYVNGIARVSVVDTSVTTGTNVGLRGESTSAIKYDTFSAGDVSAGATLGTAGSAETAQPLMGSKSSTLGTATEVDDAQPLTRAKTGTLGIASASEAAQELTGRKSATLPTASSTATAQPLTGSKAASLGQATETDSAQTLTGAKTHTLAPAGERDTALSLGTPEQPDEVDYAIGEPYALEGTGQPYTTWEAGQPW